MSDAGHHNPFRSTIASEFVSNDHTRMTTSRSPQQPAKEMYGRESIPPWLHKDVEHNAVLINGSPEVMSNAVDLEENLIQMPLVAGSSTPSPEAIGIRFAELVAPAPDCFVANHHATCSHHLFYITKAHAEPEVEPNAFRDDLSRESVATVEVV